MKLITLIIALSICIISNAQKKNDPVTYAESAVTDITDNNEPGVADQEEKIETSDYSYDYGYVIDDETDIEEAEEMEEFEEFEVMDDVEEFDDEEVIEPVDEIEEIKTGGDTVTLNFKKHTITIIEKDGDGENKEFDFDDYEDENDWNCEKKKKKSKFEGHWESLNIGMPNMVDKDYNISRPSELSYMDLNTSKSWNANLNMGQQCISIVPQRIGIVTGMGFDFTVYHFDNNNTIIKDSVGVIVPVDILQDVKKSVLRTTQFSIPLLIEFQPIKGPKNNDLYIACGIIGQLQIASSTKVVYNEDGDKKKDKEKGDFNINPFRYSYTVRVGYGDFGIYGIYSPVTFFEKDKGPELYPISVGISVNFD